MKKANISATAIWLTNFGLLLQSFLTMMQASRVIRNESSHGRVKVLRPMMPKLGTPERAPDAKVRTQWPVQEFGGLWRLALRGQDEILWSHDDGNSRIAFSFFLTAIPFSRFQAMNLLRSTAPFCYSSLYKISELIGLTELLII